MDRAFICDLKQCGLLLLGQWSGKVDVSLNSIEHSLSRLTRGAVAGVNLGVSQMDGNFLKGPTFSSSVHAHGHRSARAQRGEQQIVRRRSRVRAARGQWFIRDEATRARDNFLRESGGAASDHYIPYVALLVCPG